MRTRFIVLLGLLVLVGGWAYLRLGNAGPTSDWQGWVEGDFLYMGPDEAGRLVSLDVKEGQTVKRGAPLFSVQSDIQDADWRQAKAAVEEAKAKLEKAQAAQQRPEEIAVLEAQRRRAQAALDQSGPELKRAKELNEKGFAAQSRLDAAEAAFARDTAALSEVEKQIDVARLQSRREDIDAAKEVVAQAQSRLASAEWRRQQRSVSAPADGTVLTIYFRNGEVVPAGRPVVSLLPPANMKVRFYVPQSVVPTLMIGQRISITCDGCAANIEANISFISPEAEFTPPVIYSREERQKLVFLIEARPTHPELLRVGQPVSVTVLSDEQISKADTPNSKDAGHT
ncbi:MAG: HlyD family secretion protein [Hyphomicrobium sp.]